MDFRKDYYKILEVGKKATKEEIRASYRRLAKLYHPDRNVGNTEVEEKFKRINEAHEVLSSEILRHQYDEYISEQEDWEVRKKEQATQAEDTRSANKRTYIRKKTVTKETRIYIKGEVTIKYWADPDEEVTSIFQIELKY